MIQRQIARAILPAANVKKRTANQIADFDRVGKTWWDRAEAIPPAAFAQLRTWPPEGTIRLMDRLDAYRSWWRPLPVWLKLVTAAGIYPAWLFIIYCVFNGASKSREALFAFGLFAAGTLLHIAFNRLNRRGNQDRGGFDFFDGE